MYSMAAATRSSLVERNVCWSRLVERAALAPTPGSGAPEGVPDTVERAGGARPGEDRVGEVLEKVAGVARTASTTGYLAVQLADAAGKDGAADTMRRVLQPVSKVAESFGAAATIWQAGRVLGNSESTLDQKMAAFNTATFSTMVAAGTLFPVTCGPMVAAGTVGLVGTELIKRLAPGAASGAAPPVAAPDGPREPSDPQPSGACPIRLPSSS